MRSQSKKRKEKSELIFKYLKSLTPFESNAISNNILIRLTGQQSDQNNNDRKKSILTNFNGQDPIIGINKIKDKKSVKFVDQITTDLTDLKREDSRKQQKLSKKKLKQKQLFQRPCISTQKQKNQNLYDSPQDILKNVSQLKISVFNSFKINQDSKIQQPHLLSRVYKTAIKNNYNHLQREDEKEMQGSERVLKDSQTQTISRAKSASFISTQRQNTSKQPSQAFNKLTYSDIATNRNSYYKQSHSNYWSTGQVSSTTTPCPSRMNSKSKILLQHENNLMIQIFKQRLSMKMFQK